MASNTNVFRAGLKLCNSDTGFSFHFEHWVRLDFLGTVFSHYDKVYRYSNPRVVFFTTLQECFARQVSVRESCRQMIFRLTKQFWYRARHLVGLLLAIIGLTGCTISSESPVFDPEDFAVLDGADGLYFLYEPWEKDFAEDAVVEVTNGLVELIGLGECDEGDLCTMKIPLIALPSSKNTYVLQLPQDTSTEGYFYGFVHRLGDYGMACPLIDEEKHEQHIESIEQIASELDIEVSSEKYYPVIFREGTDPETVLRFMDEVWLKVPREIWGCYGLIPDGKTVTGYLEEYNKAMGAPLPYD